MRFEDLQKFAYELPPELIAQEHAHPRDHSRLLVYYTQTNTIEHRYFYELPDLLPPTTALVLNTTQVVPARLIVHKKTGGKVELLFLLNESSEANLLCVGNEQLEVGDILYFEERAVVAILSKVDGRYTVQWLLDVPVTTFLQQFGSAPLPPYIKHNTQTESDKREDYQTVFATVSEQYASVAAPTASLHFTEELLTKVQQNHELIKVRLHIGLGTFATVKPENFAMSSLHREWVSVDDGERAKIELAKSIKPLLAVGTTTVRTLESLDRLAYNAGKNEWAGWTDLFIHPPYSFRYPDSMITNFHVSQSSLMCLVQAFLEHKKAQSSLMDLYRVAIEHSYRFYSLGDAMLIL